MDESWDMSFATALDSPRMPTTTTTTPRRSKAVARGSGMDRLPAVTETWEASYRARVEYEPHHYCPSTPREKDACILPSRTPLSARKLVAASASMSSLHSSSSSPRRGDVMEDTAVWEGSKRWDGPATMHPLARSSPASLRAARDGGASEEGKVTPWRPTPSYTHTPSRATPTTVTAASTPDGTMYDSTPGIARGYAPPVTALRVSRRESSPGLNASLLGGLGGMPLPEDSFLGSVGDKTYDELEVAVADNNRRRSFGIALRAPLPPSPEESLKDDDDGVAATQLPSPPRAPRLAASPHQRDYARDRPLPTVRVFDDDTHDDGGSMPPPPIPQSATSLRTTSMRSIQRRASPLRERADLPDRDGYDNDDDAPRPRSITRKPSSSSTSTGSSEPRSLRRRVESSSTLSTLSSYGRAGCASAHLGGIRELDGSIRGLDASFRLDRLDRAAAGSRLDFREPDLLDAASFRLSPPRSRPSARDIFARGGDEGTEYLRSPGATPGRKHASGGLGTEATPRRRLAHRSLPPDMVADMTFDLGQMLKCAPRPKRPSGTEESLLMPDHAEADLADLSDDEDVFPVVPPRTPRAARETRRERTGITDEQLDALDRMHAMHARQDAQRSAAAHEARMPRSESTRSALQRTSSTRSAGVQRTSSTQRSAGLQRSDSTRDVARETHAASGLTRASSTRSTLQRGESGTRARPLSQQLPSSASVRRLAPSTSGRSLAPSTSGRSLATLASGPTPAGVATPRAARAPDRPDVPLTMRRRAHERAASTASAATLAHASGHSSEDRWADAVERDLVPQFTTRRGVPSSTSIRRLTHAGEGQVAAVPVPGLTCTSSTTGSGLTHASTASTGLTRTTSVRSTTTKTSAPPTLGGAPIALTRTHSLSSSVRARASDAPRPSIAPRPSTRPSIAPRTTTTTRTLPSSSSGTSLASAATATRTPAPPTMTRTSSRPSLAPRTQVGIPPSSSSRALGAAASGIPKSGPRGSLAPASKPASSSSRHSLAPARPTAASSAVTAAAGAAAAAASARAPALTPGAGVALARTKLSAPAPAPAPHGPDARSASPQRLGHRRGASHASARSSRPPVAAVPATPAGRAPRAAMVPRTVPRRVE